MRYVTYGEQQLDDAYGITRLGAAWTKPLFTSTFSINRSPTAAASTDLYCKFQILQYYRFNDKTLANDRIVQCTWEVRLGSLAIHCSLCCNQALKSVTPYVYGVHRLLRMPAGRRTLLCIEDTGVP